MNATFRAVALCAMAAPLFAQNPTPLPWAEELKKRDLTIVVTKLERPPQGLVPMVDALPLAEGVYDLGQRCP